MIEIPGYTLQRQLGRGGMGEVYLALQQSLGREVALKLLLPALSQDPVASERFVREARIAANLHHPHIVPIHDVGVHQGTAYLAMEYESGGTVAAVAQDGADISTVLKIARDIAEALDYAHRQGVVHRDVKPENVLRRPDGLCLLSDFGIARAVEAKTILTHEGSSVGTPQYMSPEQLRGQNIDGRSDLYSLGVVLYQLLTGELPYSGRDSWAIGMQHINSPIPRLSPALAHLQPLIDSLMAKDPGARPQTGAEVVNQIDALLATAIPGPTRPFKAASPTAHSGALTRQQTPVRAPSVNDFLQSLRERKLLQWALAYVAAAFALIQVFDIVAQRFGWPEPIVRGFIIALAIGFFITIVLAWYHGERGAQRVTGTELLILALLLSIGGTIMWRAAQGSRERATEADANKPAALRNTIVDKSIAVLPFDNLSEEKGNAYFATGIQDEILTRLARISALKVISRTSTQQYASKPGNLAEIANQLGVSNILEGSVQKVGDSVRINVQLIRADGDSHLWAETYDRKLTDIFGVESEVATAIAGSLQATLTGSEQRALAVKPTDNAAAYDAYLRGWALEGGSGDDSYRLAAAAYAEAVRLDPRFALAWAHLAVSRSWLYFNGSIDIAENTADSVKQAADTALQLQPELGEAWLAQGYYRYRVLRDFPGALQTFGEARKRLPNNAQVLEAFAFVQHRMGRWDEGLSNMQQAVQLDPRNLNLLMALASEFLSSMRRFADAQAVLDRALLIAPGNTEFIVAKASIYFAEGRFDEAAKLVDPLPLVSKDEQVFGVKVSLLLAQGRFDAVIAKMQPLLPKLGEPLTIEQAGIANILGYAQLHAGHVLDARSTFNRVIHKLKAMPAATVRAHDMMLLASAYAGIGDKQAALDQARKAVESCRDDANLEPQADTTLAQVQAWAGDTNAAIAALPHLLQVPRGVMLGYLQTDLEWDPLRKDPRFQRLLADAKNSTEAKQ